MSANYTERKSDSPDIFLPAARRGNRDAFVALVSPHVPNLRRLARSFTRNAEDAEDVCQQSLLKAFTKLNHFASAQEAANAEFSAWLAKITANSAIDFLRRTRSVRMVALEECHHLQKPAADSWGENPEACYARRERSQILLEAVLALPAGLRTVCMLRNLKELSTQEVADRLRLPAVTVRVRLFRAHCELRKRLGGVGSLGCAQVRATVSPGEEANSRAASAKKTKVLRNSAKADEFACQDRQPRSPLSDIGTTNSDIAQRGDLTAN